MKKILSMCLVFVLAITLTSCNSGNNNANSSNSGSSNAGNSNGKTQYVLGDTFQLGGLEITFGADVQFIEATNKVSDYSLPHEYMGKVVVKIPVTVKNSLNETNDLSWIAFMYFFGLHDTEQENNISYYFVKDSIILMDGAMRPGASYAGYYYFLYEGDGDYVLEFTYGTSFELKMTIKK